MSHIKACVCVHCAGSAVEEGLQWDIRVSSNDDLRTNRVNKSLAAMLTLRYLKALIYQQAQVLPIDVRFSWGFTGVS